MQAPISKGVTTDPSTAQVLEQWGSGYQAPLTLVPTVHRIDHVNASPYVQRTYERPSVGTTGLPTVHRLQRTGEPASRRHGEDPLTTRRPPPPIGGPKRQNHAFFSGILTPSAISRVWRRGVCRALYAIHVVFFGLPPIGCLGGRGSWRHFYFGASTLVPCLPRKQLHASDEYQGQLPSRRVASLMGF
jgi:hypothetical protein